MSLFPRPLISICVLLAASFLAVGCVTIPPISYGGEFDVDQAQQIVDGETTAEQLQELLGPPLDRGSMSQGYEIWSYFHGEVDPQGTSHYGSRGPVTSQKGQSAMYVLLNGVVVSSRVTRGR